MCIHKTNMFKGTDVFRHLGSQLQIKCKSYPGMFRKFILIGFRC